MITITLDMRTILLLQEQTKKSEEQAKEMSWQTGQLAGEVVTSREQLQQQLQEAIKQLSEVSI